MGLKRQTPEEIAAWRARSKPIQRKPLKRKPAKAKKKKAYKVEAPAKRGRNARGEAHDILTQALIDVRRRFRMAAAGQKVCACCGRNRDDSGNLLSWDAHHVVEKQWFRNEGWPKIERYHPDNALRLCERCHSRHTSGTKRLHLGNLKTKNLEYAFEVMGLRAVSYLRRRYRGEDERLERLERQHGG